MSETEVDDKQMMAWNRLDLEVEDSREKFIEYFTRHRWYKRMHPEDIAKQMGIPYELVLAFATDEPRIAGCFVDLHTVRDRSDLSSNERSGYGNPLGNPLDLKAKFVHNLFEHSQLAAKICALAESAIPGTKEGNETIMTLMKNGVLNLLPKEVASKNQQVPVEEELKGMTQAQLAEVAGVELSDIEKLAAQKHQADQRRLEYSHGVTIETSEHLDGSEDPDAEAAGRAEAPEGADADGQAVSGDSEP